MKNRPITSRLPTKSGRKYTTVQFHFDLKKGVKLDYINESNDQALTVKNINSSHRDPKHLRYV